MSKASFLHIGEKIETFPAQQKNVCKYIQDHYDKVAFMTVEQLAESVGVSPATIVRTVDRMGYSNYQALKDEIVQVLLSTKMPSPDQIDEYWKNLLSSKLPTRHQLEGSWVEPDGENKLLSIARKNAAGIHAMLTPHLVENFSRSVSLLSDAKRIMIMGQRSSRSAALYFYLLLREFLPAVHLLGSYGTDGMYDEMFDLNEEDALFAISYGSPLYARRTIDAVKFLNERSIPVVLLTDSLKNPAVPFASQVLLVPSMTDHYSLVPVMTVLDALIVEIGRNQLAPAKRRLRDLWKVISESDITVSTPELQEEMNRRLSEGFSSK
jgi:DNA-binding MurR/RpiR family transcriptional regulator